MNKPLLTGSWAALVTPFHNGSIDHEGLYRLLDLHLEAKTDGLVICGTTGEAPTLSVDEKIRLMKMVAARVANRISLVLGTGGNDTASAVEFTKLAADLGAQGVLVVTPYYNKPTQAGLIAHYQAIAAATSLGVILYNVPGRTGVNMTAATTLELAKTANIRAVKEASGNLDQTMDILKNAPPGFVLLSGDDSLNLAVMAVGGKGVISVTANVAPKSMKDFCDAALAGNWDNARRIHFDLLDLHRALFIESNPIPVKTALVLKHLIQEEFRLPLVKAMPATREKLGHLLERMGKIAC